MFRFTYGFTCTCPSCVAFKLLDTSQPVPDREELESLGTSLRKFVFPDPYPDTVRLPSSPVDLETVPFEILRVFRESCLTSLCESFSTFSHDGPFESALEVGLTVLAFYVVIYPPNYPQIGVFPDFSPGIWLISILTLTRDARAGDGKDSMECLHYYGRRRYYDTARGFEVVGAS